MNLWGFIFIQTTTLSIPSAGVTGVSHRVLAAELADLSSIGQTLREEAVGVGPLGSPLPE